MTPAYVILGEYNIPGKFVDIVSENHGFINDTNIVTFRNEGRNTRYVLQRVNHNVFRYPEDVMNNLRVITNHLREREAADNNEKLQFAEIIPTASGHDFHRDDDGNVWRILTFIEGAAAFQSVQGLSHAEECGKVLGRFLDRVSDIDSTKVRATIKGYHVPSNYLRQFDETAKVDAPEEMLKFVEAHRERAVELEVAQAKGILKTRIIHGDPRINNIMIDETTGKGVAMIDLDTASAGLVQMDVGDAVRSICNPAGEDVQFLEEVEFRKDIYEAFMKGFYATANHFLTEVDKDYIVKAIKILPFELGLRFLTDHMRGDKYFKVRRHGQNLRRAMGQFKLCELIESAVSD